MKSVFMIFLLGLAQSLYAQDAVVESPSVKKGSAKKVGSMSGYQLLNESEDIYSKIGIQKADFIKSLDGKAITTAHEAMAVMNNMLSFGVHELEVEKKGKIEKIKYEIKRAFKVIK